MATNTPAFSATCFAAGSCVYMHFFGSFAFPATAAVLARVFIYGQVEPPPPPANAHSLDWDGTSPGCFSSQTRGIKTLLVQKHQGGNRSPSGRHQQATKGPFRGASDALVLAGDARDSRYLLLLAEIAQQQFSPAFFCSKNGAQHVR